MQLKELLTKITALPWKKRSGDPTTENEVCFVRGVTIFGPKRAVACGDDARYIEHAANVLPEFIVEVNVALRDSESGDTTRMAMIAATLRNALKSAENVK